MKPLVIDSLYNEIPDRGKNKVKCICITFTENDSVLREIMLLEDDTLQEQFGIYHEILANLILSGKRALYLLNIERSVVPFNRTRKWKGLWWEGKKGKKRFARQSEEILLKDEGFHIRAAYAQIGGDELVDLLRRKEYTLLCFSDEETIRKLFKEKKEVFFQENKIIEYFYSSKSSGKLGIVFKKNPLADYLLSSNAILFHFYDLGYEGSGLFMYGTDRFAVELLKEEINQILSKRVDLPK